MTNRRSAVILLALALVPAAPSFLVPAPPSSSLLEPRSRSLAPAILADLRSGRNAEVVSGCFRIIERNPADAPAYAWLFQALEETPAPARTAALPAAARRMERLLQEQPGKRPLPLWIGRDPEDAGQARAGSGPLGEKHRSGRGLHGRLRRAGQRVPHEAGHRGHGRLSQGPFEARPRQPLSPAVHRPGPILSIRVPRRPGVLGKSRGLVPRTRSPGRRGKMPPRSQRRLHLSQ